MHATFGTKKATILVVDDAPSNLSLISDLLKGEYQIKIANCGMRALEIARSQQKPDLILLDVLMPDIDGYAVCRELKRDAATEQIPVIFLTARSDPADEEHGLMLGAIDYITKPISPPVVLARIRTHIQLQAYASRMQSVVNSHAAELNHARERFAQLTDLALDMAYATTEQAVLELALRRGMEMLNCDAGTFFLRTSNETLRVAAHLPISEAAATEEIPLYDAHSGQPNTLDTCANSLHLRKTMVIDDISQEHRYSNNVIRHINQVTNYCTVSMLVVPVIPRDHHVRGVLCFHNARGNQPGPFVPFDSRDVAYLEAHAAQTAATLARLAQVSVG